MNNRPIILHKKQGNICIITLNRPEKHNAFNNELITTLTSLLQTLDQDKTIRILILNAAGRHFCAGADLEWMKDMAHSTKKENEADTLELALLLDTLNSLSKPIIGLVQGVIMGGGIGLVACCDIVIAEQGARFCFSEAKLGLIPATIAPYIIRSIGFSAARYYFISTEMFDAKEAEKIGLVHRITSKKALFSQGLKAANSVTKNGPTAIEKAKKLLNTLQPVDQLTIKYTATLLASIRSTSEAKEGIHAFLEKRPPNWITKHDKN